MFKNKTALVLGAGSSKTFGLPLGSELRDQISGALAIKFDDFGSRQESGSRQITEAFRILSQANPSFGGQIDSLVHAANDIAQAMPGCSSIDDYIERHAGNDLYEICAKLAIAALILEAERKSLLYFDFRKSDGPDFSKIGSSWLSQFLQGFTRGLKADALEKAFANLNVITFNYDRCFEQMTYFWLRQVYKIDEQAARALVSKINIVHAYGVLGSTSPMESQYIPFGGEIHPNILINMSRNLRTYSESIDEDNIKDTIRPMLWDCINLVFMGFAFHPQNMKLLNCSPASKIGRKVFASTFGISAPRMEIIRQSLCETLDCDDQKLHISQSSVSCEHLLTEFSDNIAA